MFYIVGRACPCVGHTVRLGAEGPGDTRAAGATGEVGDACVRGAHMEGVRSQNLPSEKLLFDLAGGKQRSQALTDLLL